jgi:general stress protein 26
MSDNQRNDTPSSSTPRTDAPGTAAPHTEAPHTEAPRTETEQVEDDMTAVEVTGPEAIARLKELVVDIDIAALTTRDAAGNLVSRPMSTREMDENGDIWFFTLDDSKKVDDAELHHEVGLAYLDTSGHRYVSIAGRATVVHDRTRMERLYSPSLDIWFENGLDTPALALLRVTPVECEYWEPRHGKLATAAGMLKALVTRDTPDDTMVHGRVSC